MPTVGGDESRHGVAWRRVAVVVNDERDFTTSFQTCPWQSTFKTSVVASMSLNAARVYR
jgi:hypothetical protein